MFIVVVLVAAQFGWNHGENATIVVERQKESTTVDNLAVLRSLVDAADAVR